MHVTAQWRHAAAVVAFHGVFFAAFFAPAWLAGRLLAPGDGTWLHVPAFLAPPTLWSSDMMGGFPAAAEPLNQTYYPLARLLALLGVWNVFVISAYVLAAGFTYGYVYALTGDRFAALVSSLIYGTSGFLIVHLGHTALIHGAAWIPLMLWSAERLRQRPTAGWLAGGALAVALCAVSAHPQMLVYGAGLTAAYVLVTGWTSAHRGRYFATCALAAALGVGLAGAQLLPTVELGRLSARAALSFEESVTYALPPAEAIQLLFPNLFGSHELPPYYQPNIGAWGLTETTGYVGWLALAAAAVAVRRASRRDLVRFWVGVAVVSCLLALGNATPLAHLVYVMPGYNWFRCPGRHLVELTCAAATLAGLGIARLGTAAPAQLSRRAAALVLLVAAGGGLIVWMSSDRIRTAVLLAGRADFSLLPWSNLSVGLPLLLAALSAWVLLWWASAADRPGRRVALLAVLVADLGSFGWFAEWRFLSPAADVLTMPAFLQPFKEEVAAHQARVFSFDVVARPEAAGANLNRLWGIANVAAFTSIPLQRFHRALPWLEPKTLGRVDRVLDVLAVRYLFLNRDHRAGFDWGRDVDRWLEPRRPRTEWALGDGWVTHVGIVGFLGQSVNVADDAVVGRVVIETPSGDTAQAAIRAGEHLSEWAYERGDVVASVRHRRAPIFASFPVVAQGETFLGHEYLAVIDLGGRYRARRLAVELTDPSVRMIVRRVSARDALDPSRPIYPAVPDERWRFVSATDSVVAFENRRALPRAWLVGQVATLPATAILRALRSSRLPSGAPFDPRTLALVEEPLALEAPTSVDGHVDVLVLDSTVARVRARSATPAFLVMSDVNYPGWTATVDGEPAHIYQTNYLLRGVALPAGEHVVELTFRSLSVYAGWAVSLLSLAALASVRWWWRAPVRG